MVWNGFCTVREQMVIFLLTSFFSIVQYRGRNSKKNIFLKKNLKNLKSSNSLNWILHYKRALEKIFSDFLLLTFGV